MRILLFVFFFFGSINTFAKTCAIYLSSTNEVQTVQLPKVEELKGTYYRALEINEDPAGGHFIVIENIKGPIKFDIFDSAPLEVPVLIQIFSPLLAEVLGFSEMTQQSPHTCRVPFIDAYNRRLDRLDEILRQENPNLSMPVRAYVSNGIEKDGKYFRKTGFLRQIPINRTGALFFHDLMAHNGLNYVSQDLRENFFRNVRFGGFFAKKVKRAKKNKLYELAAERIENYLADIIDGADGTMPLVLAIRAEKRNGGPKVHSQSLEEFYEIVEVGKGEKEAFNAMSSSPHDFLLPAIYQIVESHPKLDRIKIDLLKLLQTEKDLNPQFGISPYLLSHPKASPSQMVEETEKKIKEIEQIILKNREKLADKVTK
ncbi:MAG: hypothetical protein AB7F43_11455 [Bacteriovoracia bacterium]